ncbi:MAG TPA: hypothetical protein EYN08_02020, partial [Gammaproteobacteria bacterium]|nr:hypothetical protein [Gammaproteobacteria bacterium]
MAKVSKGSIGTYSRGKLIKIIDDRASGLVSGGEANQNAFSTIIVKGQDGAVSGTLAADTSTDTLSLVGGHNITLTADAGTDTVTISLDAGFSGGGGSTNPAGSDTQIQFNDGGSFGGDSGLTYNKTTDTLSATRLSASNGLAVVGDAFFDSATFTGKLTASNGLAVTGDVSFDDAVFTGDVTLGNAATDV